jgi:hypothetical protein
MPQGGFVVDQSQRVDLHGRTMGMAGGHSGWILANTLYARPI